MSAFHAEAVPVDKGFVEEPAAWLAAQAKKYGLRYLLAHADDGIIWGRWESDGLHTSGTVAPAVSPPLRGVTLQQCRLFGLDGELLLWQDDGGWHARLVTDGQGAKEGHFDEDQLLWGSHAEPIEDGFSLLREGAQGLRHAVPIVVTDEQLQQHQLRLRVRHYVEYSPDGEAHIALSRLVTLLPASS